MIQKVIKIGSSAGVTIPKKQLQELGVSIGDEIKIAIEPAKNTKHTKLIKEYEKFVAQYGETLKNLVDR